MIIKSISNRISLIIQTGNYSGTANIHDVSQKRRVILNNQLGWIAFGIMAGYIPIWSFFGFYSLAFNLLIWQALFIWPIFYWNSKGFHTWASYSLILGCTLGIGGDAVLDGRGGGHHYYFFSSAFFAVILFDIRDRLKFIVAAAIPVSVWLIIEWFDFDLIPKAFRVQENIYIHQIYLINMLGSYTLCAYLFFRFAKTSQDFEKKVVESSKMAALGVMASGIAHEVNNPLAVVMGAATQIERMLTQEPIPAESIKAKASKIISTSQRIGKIIQGLRYFSRHGEKDPFSQISVKHLLEDTLEICRDRFGSNHISILVDPIPEVDIPARAVQLSQVLLNLLNNAFDATQKLDEKFVEIKFQRSSETFSIFISNSGPKIPDAIAERIFVPFFTTKEIGKGTGLGLSISKGIIEDHEGELLLHQEMPLTTFEIRLPLARKESHAKAE